MNWQTLLVPHDFSPSADRALTEAASLARLHHAKVVLVNITHLPPGLHADSLLADPRSEAGEMIRVDAYAKQGAITKLESLAAPMREHGLDVEVRAAIGDVVEQILKVTEDEKVDLIVMGTHGRTGLAHFFVGSMTEKVLRHATVPVLTVRIAEV